MYIPVEIFFKNRNLLIINISFLNVKYSNTPFQNKTKVYKLVHIKMCTSDIFYISRNLEYKNNV